MVAVSVAASDAKRKPRPVRIVEPGALAYDYARDDLLVADRKLNRVVRIDLRSGKRRVAVTGLRDIVGLAYDDMTTALRRRGRPDLPRGRRAEDSRRRKRAARPHR